VESETRYRREVLRSAAPGIDHSKSLALVALAVSLVAALVAAHAAAAKTRSTASHVTSAAHARVPASFAGRTNPWSAYVATDSRCPGAGVVGAPLAAGVRTMACLINYARTTRGLRKLAMSPKLSVAARLKAEQIQRCGVYDHAPCGGTPWGVADRVGYPGSFGENLYLGETTLGSPRGAVEEWLASRPHRENMFSKSWRVQSLYAAHVDELDGFVDATLWVAQFGDR